MTQNNQTLRVLDVFAGAGGFSLGFELAGCKVVGGIEVDSWAAETFQSNHPDAKVIVRNIKEITNREIRENYKGIDILLGAPPCQGFSICNKNAGDPKDPRNSLFTEMIRLAKVLLPKVLIIENVPNLLKAKTEKEEKVIEIICSELKQLGYYVSYDVLDATSFGVTQIRKKLFVIASKVELKNPFPRPTHTVYGGENELSITPTLWEAISDLPDIEAREGAEIMDYTKPLQNEYQLALRNGSDKVYNHKAMMHSKRTVERFSHMECGQSINDVPEHLMPLKRNGNGVLSKKAFDQNSRRMYPHKQCHTIPASIYANFVHPFKNRNFTCREGAKIQSFPCWYVVKGKPTVVSTKLLEKEGREEEKHLCQYNQIGNAVPPLLAKAIAQNLLKEI